MKAPSPLAELSVMSPEFPGSYYTGCLSCRAAKEGVNEKD